MSAPNTSDARGVRRSGPRARCVIAALGLGLATLGPTAAWAQMTPEEHASHHPGGSGGASPAQGAPSSMEHEGEGYARRDLLYPTLIRLPRVSAAQRGDLVRAARTRLSVGVGMMSEGLDHLAHATRTGDDAAMSEAAAQVRTGLDSFESGLQTARSLEAGRPPRDTALDWYRRTMSVPAARTDGAMGGLSWLHASVMALLAAFSAVMLWMYAFKMRRASALLVQLTGPAAAPTPADTPASASPAAVPASPTAVPASTAAVPASPAEVPAPPAPVPAAPADVPMPPAPVPAPPTPVPAPPAPVPAPPAAVPAPPAPVPVTPPVDPPLPVVWTGTLEVTQIFAETPSAKTFILAPPDKSPLPFTFLAGQFLSLAVVIEGQSVRRSYSIASSPGQHEAVEITVKREPLGLVSRYLHDKVKVGDRFEVSAPLGRFTFTGQEADAVVLIAGGSGIMAMMSVIRDLTERHWPGSIDLLYSAHSPGELIYRHELDLLRRRHPNLRVVAIASRPDGDDWLGLAGRLNKELIGAMIPEIRTRRIHLCGPASMMDAVRGMLADLGVPADHIRSEAFGPARPPAAPTDAAPAASPEAAPRAPATAAVPPTAVPKAPAKAAAPPAAPPAVPAAAPPTAPAVAIPVASTTPATAPPAAPAAKAAAPPAAPVLVTFGRSKKTVPFPPEATMLEVAERAGVPIEWSCRVGTCGVCKVKLLRGQVTMAVQDALTPEDKTANIVLACQARATAPVEVDA